MRKKGFPFELLEIILGIVTIVLTIILFFKSRELTILFPIVFGLGAVLSAIHALEGKLYNQSHVVEKKQMIIYFTISAVLILFMVISILTIINLG